MILRRDIRLAISALLVLVVLGAGAASASAAKIQITNQISGKSVSVEFDDLTGNYDVDADYEIRGSSGTTTERVRGISLAHLMDVASPGETYSSIQIAKPGGGSVTVSRTQMIGGGLTPVVYAKGPDIVFLRPSYREGDYNSRDIVASAGGLTFTQTRLNDVAVLAKASKLKARVGERIVFNAEAVGGVSGARYEFTWVFRDGKSARGDEVAHAFRRRGSYQVIVTAKEPESSKSSTPSWVTVQVGPKVESDKKRSGGGTNDSAGAPTSGASDGSGGSGDVATGGEKTPPRGRTKRDAEAEGDLPVVSGQVLSAVTEPLIADNGLAARSGQEDRVKTGSNFGIGTTETVAIVAIIVLLLGLLSEFGVFSALRRWRRELRAA